MKAVTWHGTCLLTAQRVTHPETGELTDVATQEGGCSMAVIEL